MNKKEFESKLYKYRPDGIVEVNASGLPFKVKSDGVIVVNDEHLDALVADIIKEMKREIAEKKMKKEC